MSNPRPGRRIAQDRARPVDRGARVALVMVVIASALLLLTSSGDVSESGNGAGKEVLVDHAVHGCPRFSPPAGTSTTVATGAAPVADVGSSGSIRHGEPGKDVSSARGKSPARGKLLRIEPGRKAPRSLVVEATDELAAGLFTFQEDTGRTTALTDCPSPASSWWFTGAGATLDQSSELVLSNVDPGPAVVDIRFFGPGGVIDSIGTRGLTIPAETQRTISLTDVAPQGKQLAVSVVTSRGRVVAAMSDSFAAGFGASSGHEWIPPQSSASRVLHLSGVPGKADSHELVLANPSSLEALVKVKISGASGAFAPTSNATVRVPPGTVVSTDMTSTLGTEAAAVALSSTAPVTATVRSVANGDSSYAGSVRPLSGPAVAPVISGGTSTVQLSAGRQPASADVTAFNRAGKKVDSGSVDIAPGATSTWSPGTKRKADYVMVSPVEGQIFGAMSFAGGAGLSEVPLRPLTVRVEQPAVQPGFR